MGRSIRKLGALDSPPKLPFKDVSEMESLSLDFSVNSLFR